LGGSGKTPIVCEIAKRFDESIILSRGYGRKSYRIGQVDRGLTDEEGISEYGDEPWMLAKNLKAPIIIDKNRCRALKTIEKDKQEHLPLVIMDDGFQHLRIKPTVSIVVISATADSNGFTLPLGDLREPLSALKNASVLVMTGSATELKAASVWNDVIQQTGFLGPIFLAKRQVAGLCDGDQALHQIHSLRAGGFCAIARPERFGRDLEEQFGWPLFATYPDHHIYKASDVDEVVLLGSKQNVTHFVTTEKDYYKVKKFFVGRSEKLFYLKVSYDLPKEFWSVLENSAWR